MRQLLISLVKGYRLLISPLLGKPCRFYPSCSEYGIEALEKHGAIKGGYLIINRILRCHPFAKGGIDHVTSVACKHQKIKES